MEKNDSNYTLKLRRVSNRARVDQFVFMGKAGIAYMPEMDMLNTEELFQSFGVDVDMAKVLLYLAKAGAAVRYYEEERKVSAQFILDS